MVVRALLMTAVILLDGQKQVADAVSLSIAPNRSQFFEYESVTFYCEGVDHCDVGHKFDRKLKSCSKTNKTPTGSSCTIKNVYTEDSGEYWSETEGGNRSNIINITVTNGSVILEVPALPVMEGQTVTLHCRNKTSSSNFTADFYKDGRHIHRSSTGNMNIYSVSKSDEGLYKCSISGAGESPESWLKVTGGSVILEVPALPVMEGQTVTLHCRNKTSSSNLSADFYKDGRHIHRSSTGNMNIYRVSKSDEGLYKCSISGAGESPESWLKVTASQNLNSTANPDVRTESRSSSTATPWIIATALLSALLVAALGLFHFGKGSCNRALLRQSAKVDHSDSAEDEKGQNTNTAS
ncbi:low affinity immunoglobulin gamma Fc region receptor II-like [Archocentrus centrarchus]|uniref:low affinity immunoglobulin gamma Fc region receptor II-like n=1 Tax=Archocentrus centrarchus TaxID=63155 RepID=UPI0011E9DD01|nr:low affinity immunoglobulin gamma Fc region receptor II-like [Archocentrus centrarchus]